MRWQTLALHALAQVVSLARKPFPPRCGLRILMYHSVGSAVYGDRYALHSLSVERFRQHLDMLSGMRISPLLPLLIPKSELHVAITFDDGYADNLHIASPLLAERGMPFTVFVTSDFIRRHERGFLSSEELQELAQQPGVIIGAHGASHCHLTMCSGKQLRAELCDSKHYLEDLIGRSVTTLAYPYGSSDRRVRDAAISAGYQLGTCSRFDINQCSRDSLMLNRSVIVSDDTPKILHQKISGDWDWYRWRGPDPLSVASFEA